MYFIGFITDKCITFDTKSTSMDRAVISGDIIAYTSLSNADKTKMEISINRLFQELKNRYDVFGRLIKGDYLEFYIPNPVSALRIALLIKSHIKSYALELNDIDSKDKRLNVFKTHGIRLAIGIGQIKRIDLEKGIIDGEAIYFSGRTISDTSTTSDKERIVIKNTLFIKSNDEKLTHALEPILALLDVLLSKATAKQSNVLYLKLLGYNEDEIAKKMGLYQSTINEHSTSLGWNAIEKAVLYFEKLMRSKNEVI
jgi:hypothetical protein